MNDLSADGKVAVGSSSSIGPAVVWTDHDGTVVISDTGDGSPFEERHSVAQAVSADGKVIAGASELNAFAAAPHDTVASLGNSIQINQSLGMLATPQAGVYHYTETTGISGDGTVVVGYSDSDSGFQAFRWTAATGMVGLGDLPGGGYDSRIFGITEDGSVLVGAATSAEGWQAVVWTEGHGFSGLGDFPGGAFLSDARGVSNDGNVVVGIGSGVEGREAFRWTAGSGLTGLGDLPGGEHYSFAAAVSGDGSVIVGDSSSERTGALGSEAIIWDIARGMRPLTDVLLHDYGLDVPQLLERPYLSNGVDISRDGKVILGGDWLADLRDEPAPGDTNFDGRVDLADFGTLKANFGSGKYRDQGDFTADGRVDLSDFGILKANFGAAQVAAPEPASEGLALLALLIGVLAKTLGPRSSRRATPRAHHRVTP
ncbi:MAG: hypothetical protein U0836_19680 [Pirellulales bacterium]